MSNKLVVNILTNEEKIEPCVFLHDIQVIKSSIIKRVKQLSEIKIVSLLPDNKQRNSLYRLYKHSKKAKSSLTAEEKAEIADLESKWDTIEAIRAASNTIEAEINNLNLQTVEEIQNYNIVNNPLWPK